ncbi:MAG: Gfo/Idh/MocA family oxidoreductase [Acidobacteria bacterium]|nr:Gfo/Idh/MocA family oxidoreductase [Acidobacteriota bacterium]
MENRLLLMLSNKLRNANSAVAQRAEARPTFLKYNGSVTRRSLLTAVPLAAAAQGADGVSVALIESAEGDHVSNYRRLATRTGVGRYVACDVADAARMLADVRPSLVVVSTEPERMPEAAKTALRAGAHVIVDKPGCTGLDQFEEMARVADQSQRRLMLAMATRLDPAAVKAMEVIRSGWIGKVYGASMVWVADQTRLHNPAYQKTWKVSKKRSGGGKLIFHGVHYLDLLQSLTGQRIARLSAFCRNVGGAPSEVEDAAVVSMELEDGAVATLNAGYYLDKGYDREIRLYGSHGWLRFNTRVESMLEWYSTHPAAPRGVQQFRPGERASVYDLMLQSAVDSAAGKGEWFIATKESLAVLRVAFAAYRSAESGKSVTVS